MKTKLIVLGTASLVNGMRLAGVENTIVTDEKNFQIQLENILAAKEYGLVMANESLLSNLDWKMKKKLETMASPVIVPMPDSGGVSTEGEQIRALIKRALGFDLGKK